MAETQKSAAKKTAAKAEAKTEEKKKAPAPAERFVHVLILGIGSTTRNVQLVTDTAAVPKVFGEFISGFRSGRKDLVWTPTPANPVFAVRMNAVDWYEYRSGRAEAASVTAEQK